MLFQVRKQTCVLKPILKDENLAFIFLLCNSEQAYVVSRGVPIICITVLDFACFLISIITLQQMYIIYVHKILPTVFNMSLNTMNYVYTS